MADGSMMPQTFRVIAQPNPLSDELIRGHVPVGCTLADLGAGGAVVASINGNVEADYQYRPKPGDEVVLRAIPGDIPLIGFILQPFFAAGAAILGFVLDGVASLVPLPNIDIDAGGGFKPFGNPVSTRNSAIPFATVRRSYGFNRLFPLLGSRHYTEQLGETQYLRMLFDCGKGPLTFDESSARIGETLLSSYDDYEIEYRDGALSDPPVTLFTRSVIEQSLSDEFNAENDTATRTGETATRETTLDFGAPALFYRTGQKSHGTAVKFRVEMSPAGAGTWTEVTPSNATAIGDLDPEAGQNWDDGTAGSLYPSMSSGVASWYLKGQAQSPFRLTLRIEHPTPGHFDFRVTRLKAYRSEDGGLLFTEPSEDGFSEFRWTALRSFGADIAQTVEPGTALIALRIKITGQLGSVIDNFSVIARGRIPVWNGSAWVEQATSNPAWICRDILTGNAWPNPLPTSAVDDDSIKAFGAWCNAQGFDFEGEFADETTVREAFDLVAMVGRGALSITNGKYGVIYDSPDLVPTQTFSPRNGKNLQGSRNHSRLPHGLRCKFINKDADYIEDEQVVYNDGYSVDGSGGTEVATLFEDLKCFGIVQWSKVYAYARYRLKVAALRPEIFTWTADIASIVSKRGQVVNYCDDAILVGLGTGRITAIGGGAITIDTEVTIAGGSYAVTICKDTAESVTVGVTTGSGVTRVLALSGGVPAGVKVGDLVAFGEATKVTLQLLITDIKRQPGLKAQIEAVPYAPEVHDAGPIPPYDPGITRPAKEPPAPIINKADARFARGGGDVRVPRGVVLYSVPFSEVPVALAELRYRPIDSLAWTVLDRRAPSGVYTFDVPTAETDYVVSLRLISNEGVPGGYAEATLDFANVVGVVETITLTELPDTPDTRADKFSTIICTVTPPAVTTNYRTSFVRYRKSGRRHWTDVGYIDANNTIEQIVRADGTTYEFEALVVSNLGVVSEMGLIEQITVSNLGEDPSDDAGGAFSALNVTNLRLRGESAGVEYWDGQDLRLQWDGPASPPAGHKVVHYRVRLIDPDTLEILHQSREYRQRFDYFNDQNLEDSVRLGYTDSRRKINVEVIARSDLGGISAAAATMTADSSVPAIQSISVQELVDYPDTRTNRFSTLVVSVVPPVDVTRYRTALVEIRKSSHVRWEEVGLTDNDRNAYAVVSRDGQSYDLRARAVSTKGAIDPDGPSTVFVVSNLTDEGPDDAMEPFVELNVPNLRIRGQAPSVDTWTGEALRLQWDHPPSPPAGHRIAYYRVRLRQPVTGVLLHQDRTAYARFDYEIETNIRDSFANLDLNDPQRSIDVEVMAFTDAGGRSLAAAEKSAVNPSITVPAVEVKGLLQAIKLRFATPTESDYDITEICGSQTAGFTPDPTPGTGNLLVATKDTWPIRIPDLAAGVWYLRIRIRDTFGPGDWSDEIAVTVKGTQEDDTTSACRLGAFIDGYPGSSMQLLHHVFDEPVLFKAGLAKSKIRTEVAAAANWDSVIRRKSAGSWSSIGTGRVATGATTETWTFASDVTFAAGEEIEILAPATVDASLKNPTIHLVGSYV